MKKRLLGIFDTKKLTPEQIYEKVQATLQEKERLNLIKLSKKRSVDKKNETETTS